MLDSLFYLFDLDHVKYDKKYVFEQLELNVPIYSPTRAYTAPQPEFTNSPIVIDYNKNSSKNVIIIDI